MNRPERKRLAVCFAPVSDVKNFYTPFFVANRIDYPVITDAQVIERGILQFLTAKRAGVILQKDYFGTDALLKGRGQFFELSLGAADNLEMIIHLVERCLRISVRTLLKGRDFSWTFVSAIAKSIISALKRGLCTRREIIAFCSVLGKALNAVKKTSAFAWTGVIFNSSFNKKNTTLTKNCQAEMCEDVRRNE